VSQSTQIRFLLIWLFLPLFFLPAFSSKSVPRFKDITVEAGLDGFVHVNGPLDRKVYIFEAKGGGVGFFDYDKDGWLDIYIAQGSTVERVRQNNSPRGALYHNERDGSFREVTSEAGIKATGWGMGVAAGDYDGDGWTDLYLTYLGQNVLYRNNGDGTFSDATSEAGVGDPRWSTSAAFGDFDRDGHMDLYVANYLDVSPTKLPPKSEACRHLGAMVACGPRGLPGARDSLYWNRGDGTFVEVSEKTGAFDSDKLYGLGVVWADIDNDSDLDIYVANDATPNLLFLNQGDRTFVESALITGLAFNGDGMEQASMGVDVADYDNDGLLDAYTTHFSSEYSTLYHNEGDLLFRDETSRARIQNPEWSLVSWGARLVDMNHDGWKDIFHVNGHTYPFLESAGVLESYEQPSSLYLNQGDGTFADASAEAADVQRKAVGRGAAFGDFDNDGDVDVLMANMNRTPVLLRNDLASGPDTHWVMFRIRSQEGNREGIGCRLTAVTGENRQVWEIKRTVGIYSTSDPRAHFGLGRSAKLDELIVQWPTGRIQRFENVPANRHYLIDDREGLLPEGIASPEGLSNRSRAARTPKPTDLQ
jgi:hypothetical protein